jgi:hypothetical protein
MLFDEGAEVEPCPAADEHADIAIVGPPLVDLDRVHRAGLSQPVGDL